MDTPMQGRLSGAAGLARAERAPAVTLVIFGAAGDLTRRLLMPSLYNLTSAHLLDDGLKVIGVDHNERTDEEYRDTLTQAMQGFVGDKGSESEISKLDAGSWGFLRDRLSYHVGEFDEAKTFEALKEKVSGNCIFYLAVAARFFGPIISSLCDAGLMEEQEGAYRRVVVEKPFGHDLPSAKALNKLILDRMSESQVFRIDHFLGKETVQNIMALRFGNGIFEPLWNRYFIDHVQITAAETVGVEERARFYEPTGALRDMVPNHMFQLLAVTAMEPPNAFDADAVRAEKAKVIQAIKPWTPMRVARDTVRGQYTAGMLDDKPVAGYRQEKDVNPTSVTETFVAMRLKIDNFRWAGVPFYIRTGKRLAVRRTEIAIHFKQAPYAMFRDTSVDRLTPNVMVLHIQPSEGITLNLSAKVPGPKLALGGVAMDFRYSDWFKAPSSTGYETLLYDVMMGDATLFQRADMVEAGWAASQPLLDEWAAGRTRVQWYEAGGAWAGGGGPSAGPGWPALVAASLMIRLVVSDVDGTLVQPDKSLSAGTVAAAGRLQAAGVKLAIVSARPPRGMAWIVEALKLEAPYAGFNGGALIGRDGAVIEWNPAPPAVVGQALQLFAARGVDAWLFTRDEWLIRDAAGAYVAHERHTVRFDARVVADFAPYVDQVGKLVGVSEDAAKLAAVEAELQAIVGDGATAHRSQTYYLDVTHRNANKGYAVGALARHLGVTLDEVAVLGDMVNDVPMFRVAGFSVAMGNGSDETRAAANAVTGRNDAEGWAAAVDGLILPRAG